MPSSGSTSARGYGSRHQRERAKWERRQKAGEMLYCRRCHEPMPPGIAWDLGHDDHDRDGVTPTPEHRHTRDCSLGGNRATAGRRAGRPSTPTPALAWFNPPSPGDSLGA